MSQFSAETELIHLIADRLIPVPSIEDVKSLIPNLANKRIVMLGECTHGTEEFYAARRAITQALVREHGFRIIAVEGDWPEMRVYDRFITSREEADDVSTVVGQARRWPAWMWGNTEVAHLLEWLRHFNSSQISHKIEKNEMARMYGLDVYSLFESMSIVIQLVARYDQNLAQKIAENYDCFAPYGRDERNYARSLMIFSEGCRGEVLENLRLLLNLRLNKLHIDDADLLDIQQNARIVANAENYYRAMVDRSDISADISWNVRDKHMMETLKMLLQRSGPDSKAIVWAHNTHIGDYRATSMLEQNHINIGGLAREEFGEENVALIGFSTYRGSTIASSRWDGPAIAMAIPPAQPGSLDDIFERASQLRTTRCFYLPIDRDPSTWASTSDGQRRRGQRAIGVVYDPYMERFGNYVDTELGSRYDGMFFIRESNALHPVSAPVTGIEPPQTWPSGV